MRSTIAYVPAGTLSHQNQETTMGLCMRRAQDRCLCCTIATIGKQYKNNLHDHQMQLVLVCGVKNTGCILDAIEKVSLVSVL